MRTVNIKKTNRKKASLLFVLGMVSIICAGIYSYVDQSISSLSMSLLFLGVLSLLFCFIKGKSDHKSSHRLQRLGPQWKRGGIFVTIISLSMAFLLGSNYFSSRFPYRWDVTQHGQHTLTLATIDFVKGVKKPLELTAFYVGLPPKYLEDLLNEYERISDGVITTKIIDPIEDIAYAAEFGNVINGKERKLIVISGNERKDVDFSDAALSEEQVTNALARVAREPRKVYFLSGHGEFSASNQNNEGLSLFADLLNSNNISSHSLMLGIEQSIPEDCDVLIIAGPRTDLTDQERALVEGYLEQGGDALFLIENGAIARPEVALTAQQEGNNPSLNYILNNWGINIGNDTIVDLDSHVGGDVGSPATRNYVAHKAITEGLDYTFYIRPRSITALQDRRATIELAPIVVSATKQQSWAETNRTMEVNFDAGLDIPGPVPIAYVIWEEKEQGEESDTRIIAFTDADFLSNAYINQYSNAAMGINIVSWLSELDYTVFLNQKNTEVERLDLTSKQKRMIAALLFLMPLLIAIAGIFIWIRR